MKSGSVAGAALCCICLSGCLVVPLPESGSVYGRASLAKADLSFLKEGETTREEVLLRLGAPDLALRSGELLAYAWGGRGGFAVFAAGYAGGGGTIPVHHLLVLEFEAGGRLQRVRSSGSRWPGAADNPVRSAEAGSPPPLAMFVDPLPDIWTRFDAVGREEPRSRIALGDFRDERMAPYAGSLVASVDLRRFPRAEVHLGRPAAEVIRAAVAQQLRKEGFLPVEKEADWKVSGVIRHFEYQPGLTLRPARLDVALSVEGGTGTGEITRRYACTAAGEPPSLIGSGLRSVLEEFQRLIAADARLLGLLSSPARGKDPAKP